MATAKATVTNTTKTAPEPELRFATLPGQAGPATVAQTYTYRNGPLSVAVGAFDVAEGLTDTRLVTAVCTPAPTEFRVTGRESEVTKSGSDTQVFNLKPGTYNLAAYYDCVAGTATPVDDADASANQTIPALRISPKTVYTQTIKVGA